MFTMKAEKNGVQKINQKALKRRLAKQQKSWNAFQRRVSHPITAHGLTVVMFLVDAKKPARQRIERILDLLKAKARLIESAPESLPNWKKIVESSGATILSESNSPVFQLNLEIDKLLAGYKPRLQMALPTQALRESEAALALKEISAYGLAVLDLFRKCEESGERAKWFFATRPDQKFCSAKCRHKALEQTPEFKVSRKLYAREQYWSERERDLQYRIKNLSETREGQKTKAELDQKLKAARTRLKAANQERKTLATRGETHDRSRKK